MAIEENLQKGEVVIRKFRPSRLNYWYYYLAALIFLITLIIPIVLVLMAEIMRYRIVYLVTDRRIIKELGILSRYNISIVYQKITEVELRQSFIERIFSLGTIIINTAGKEGPEMMIRGVGSAMRVKSEIESAWAKGSKL